MRFSDVYASYSLLICVSVRSNVLVGGEGHRLVKVADLGMSRTLTTSDYYRKSSNDKVSGLKKREELL